MRLCIAAFSFHFGPNPNPVKVKGKTPIASSELWLRILSPTFQPDCGGGVFVLLILSTSFVTPAKHLSFIKPTISYRCILCLPVQLGNLSPTPSPDYSFLSFPDMLPYLFSSPSHLLLVHFMLHHICILNTIADKVTNVMGHDPQHSD